MNTAVDTTNIVDISDFDALSIGSGLVVAVASGMKREKHLRRDILAIINVMWFY